MKKFFFKLSIILISMFSFVASLFIVNAATLSGDEKAYFVTYDDVNWFTATYSVARLQRLERNISDKVGAKCKEAILARGLEDPYDEEDDD